MFRVSRVRLWPLIGHDGSHATISITCKGDRFLLFSLFFSEKLSLAFETGHPCRDAVLFLFVCFPKLLVLFLVGMSKGTQRTPLPF